MLKQFSKYANFCEWQDFMKPRVNFFCWQVFCQVARTGSISRAAVELGLDLQMVSRLLISLERDLGFELLDRSTRPLKPTSQGQTLLPAVQKAMAAGSELDELVQSLTASKKSIRLSLPINMTRDDLFPMLESYRRIDSGVEIVLFNDKDHQDLEEGSIDAALLPYEPHVGSVLTFDAGQSVNMLLCSPEYLSVHGRPMVPEDLKAGHTLILRRARFYPVSTAIWHRNESWSIAKVRKLRIGDAMSCKMAAVQGLGIALDLGLTFCQQEIDAGKLVPVVLGWHRQLWEMRVGIARRNESDARLVRFARWFAGKQREAYARRWKPFYSKFGATP